MPAYLVARSAELSPGQMKAVKAGDSDVLLCYVGGTYTAVHPKCSHYGAPLVKGVLNGHRLVCPWHHACFDARSGRQLEAPGCNSIRAYEVKVQDGEIWVSIPHAVADHPDILASPTARPLFTSEAMPYVIVGGGPAGARAAEGLRQGGYRGPITLISAEPHLPYDRTQLSKGFLTGDRPAEKMLLRDAAYYQELGVDVLLNKRVVSVDAAAHLLHLEDGTSLAYAKTCLATGSTARQLQVPGAQLPGVFTLRTWEHAEAIRQAAGTGKKAVVIGASFIGMEAAMALAKLGCSVTVVAPEAVPFGKTFGSRVGTVIQQWQEELGVRFELNSRTTKLEGVRKVTGVTLDTGKTLKASFVVVGIGVTPNTPQIESLPPDEHGGIAVDDQLYAGHDIWVAGDLASAPHGQGRALARIEHWRVAEQQGTVAGQAMAGATRTLMSVPFFWTNQAGRNLRYCGHHRNVDQLIFDGRPEDGPFIAYYVEGNVVAGVLGYGRDRDLAAIHELMWLECMPAADALDPAADWVAMLTAASREK